MLIIEVFKPTYQRIGTKKDGTDFEVNYQEAEIKRHGRRPKPIEINIPRAGAYVQGLYTLTDSSFRPDNYDRLSLAPYIQLMSLDDGIQVATAAEKEHSVASPKVK